MPNPGRIGTHGRDADQRKNVRLMFAATEYSDSVDDNLDWRQTMKPMTILALCLPLVAFAGGHKEHPGKGAGKKEHAGQPAGKKEHAGKAAGKKEHAGKPAGEKEQESKPAPHQTSQ